ncbi:OmpH family outer membrane protein [Candidatus Pelagibacter sp.]|nr:OmpH family outer membrane protein [Candidatus Pelagibacter sp.]
MKKIYQYIKIILLSFFLTNNLYAQDKIAFIDLNYIYSNSKVGKKIIKEIQSKRKVINQEFQDFQKKLNDEKNDLLAQKNVLAEDEFKKKYTELENNLAKYNKIIDQKNKDLVDYQNKSKKEFASILKSTLEKYSKENSIAMILRKENLLIGKNSLDVTKDILDLFNKS